MIYLVIDLFAKVTSKAKVYLEESYHLLTGGRRRLWRMWSRW